MTTHFGFIPTDELNQKIDDIIDSVNNQPDTHFYPLQLEVTHSLAHELLDNLFVHLVTIIENKKRKERMEKLVNTINSAVDTLLKHIIVDKPNDVVMDSFNFLLESCIFDDNEGQRRLGFILSDDEALTIVNNFSEARNIDNPQSQVQEAMKVIIETNLKHFINDFSAELHLGLIKRKTIPIAEAAINKASQIALNKLLPEMPHAANMRLIDHFENFIIVK